MQWTKSTEKIGTETLTSDRTRPQYIRLSANMAHLLERARRTTQQRPSSTHHHSLERPVQTHDQTENGQ
eukprot:6174025-Pleurochrysis_carterae.AAC.1